MRRYLSLILLLALLAACGPGAPDDDLTAPDVTVEPAPQATAETGQVTISFAAWEYERQLYEPLANQFMAENPNIKVVLIPLDDLVNVGKSDEPQNPLNMLRRIVSGADTAPSMFVAPEAYGTNLLMDLKPLMDADATFQRDDFYPGTLEQVTINGGTWTLPRYFYVQLLTYNKDLYQLANLPEPQSNWTWQDLIGAAEQIAKKNGNAVETYGFLDPTSGIMPLATILKAQGIDVLNTPPKDVQLDRPEVIAAIERVSEMGENGALFRPRYVEGAEPIDISQLVRDGRVGIWADDFIGPVVDESTGSMQAPTYAFEVGKVVYPSDSSLFGYTSPGDGYIVSGGTAHPNESWKWIEFLSRQTTDQPGQGYYGMGRVPARKSLAEKTGFWNNLDEQTVATYQAALASAADRPPLQIDYTVIGTLGQALSQVIDEGKDAGQAVQDAQQMLEEQVSQVQLTPTPEPDTNPVVVATPEPQEAPAGATQITFGIVGYGTSEIRQLSRAFREQNPDIFVQIKSTDTFTGPVEMRDIARTSDCFSWWSAPQSDEDFKALLDLQPLFDADTSFPQSDYADALMAPYRRDGGLYGLPYAVNLRTLNFNRTAFDAAGIQTPTYQWKPSDFLAAAQTLTTGEGDRKQYGYVPLYGAQQDMFFFVGQFGGRIMLGSGTDARPNFADPKVVEAIQWYLDLAGKHEVMPELKFPYKRDDPGFEDKSYELIQTGRAGMWFDQGYGMFGNAGGPGIARPIDPGIGGPGGGQPVDFEVGIAPLPIAGGGLRSSDFYARGFHISAQTQQAQACWEWLKFLSGDIVNLQGGIPARISVASSEEFAQQTSPEMVELVKIYAEALRQPGQPGDDQNAFYSRMDTYWFFKAVSEAIEGETPLDQGLDEAQKLTNAYLDCLDQNPGKPATCANQVDPTYQGYSTEDPSTEPGVPMPLG